MQKAVTEVEVRGDAEEDPGRVDWVTSHPPLEQPPPPQKNIYIYIMRGKTNGNTCVPKTL